MHYASYRNIVYNEDTQAADKKRLVRLWRSQAVPSFVFAGVLLLSLICICAIMFLLREPRPEVKILMALLFAIYVVLGITSIVRSLTNPVLHYLKKPSRYQIGTGTIVGSGWTVKKPFFRDLGVTVKYETPSGRMTLLEPFDDVLWDTIVEHHERNTAADANGKPPISVAVAYRKDKPAEGFLLGIKM
ncbi:MAG: hypothetical protein HZC28_08435 [Spirochaetes bacterium]|nr:hypothetical protein [Spirochaetota bacterium]